MHQYFNDVIPIIFVNSNEVNVSSATPRKASIGITLLKGAPDALSDITIIVSTPYGYLVMHASHPEKISVFAHAWTSKGRWY